MMTIFEVGEGGPDPRSDPAKDIEQMKSFKETYPKPPNPYDIEAMEAFDEELYGEGR